MEEKTGTEALRNIAPRWLRESESVLYLSISAQGRLTGWNPAVPARLGYSGEELVGITFEELLAADQTSPLEHVDEGGREGEVAESRLVNFVDSRHRPLTLSCRVFAGDDADHIVATDVPGDREQLEEQLMSLNRELAMVSREEARRARELARTKEKLQDTLNELENSYWHLKKVQEVLPVCMHCGRIRGEGTSWDGLVEYLRKNSIFVSHGLCPSCEERYYSEERLENDRPSGDAPEESLGSESGEGAGP